LLIIWAPTLAIFVGATRYLKATIWIYRSSLSFFWGHSVLVVISLALLAVVVQFYGEREFARIEIL
ncbi:MAG TPA: hypothetical protein VGN61_05345, partial [Verrucomicrobiae bacterium]